MRETLDGDRDAIVRERETLDEERGETVKKRNLGWRDREEYY